MDVQWAVGIVQTIKALLDDGEDTNVSFSETKDRVEQIIDLNQYVPTTLNGFDFKVVGTGVGT
jgi:hypothetical protein